MKPKKNGKIKIWKWLFLALLACNVGVYIVLINRVQDKREDLTVFVQNNPDDVKIGTFTTTREQLNQTLENYLKEYQTKDFEYSIALTSQQIVFEGSYKLFGVEIPLYLYFQPSKMKDGSIMLQIMEVSAGSLSLPKAEVLNYLKKNYKFPDYVHVDTEASRVQVQLQEMENKLGIYAKMNTLDLYNDQFIIDIYKAEIK